MLKSELVNILQMTHQNLTWRSSTFKFETGTSAQKVVSLFLMVFIGPLEMINVSPDKKRSNISGHLNTLSRDWTSFGRPINQSFLHSSLLIYLFIYWKRLFARTVPEKKNIFAGTLPENKKLFAGTLPANKKLFAGTLMCSFYLVLLFASHMQVWSFKYRSN